MRRIALIGLGAAAQHIHLPAYRGLVGASVVAGCDARPVAKAWPFPVFDSLNALLDAQTVDIAVIATPPETHASLARTCLERGVHVLCEKPFTPTVDEGLAL